MNVSIDTSSARTSLQKRVELTNLIVIFSEWMKQFFKVSLLAVLSGKEASASVSTEFPHIHIRMRTDWAGIQGLLQRKSEKFAGNILSFILLYKTNHEAFSSYNKH